MRTGTSSRHFGDTNLVLEDLATKHLNLTDDLLPPVDGHRIDSQVQRTSGLVL